MRSLSTVLIVCLLTLLIVGTLSAQWVQTSGPASGDIRELAVSGSNLLALTGSQMYRSTDNGTTWKQTGPTYGGRHSMHNPAILGSYFFVIEGYDGGPYQESSWLIISTDNDTMWTSPGDIGANGPLAMFPNATGGISIFANGLRWYPAVSYDTGKSWDTISIGYFSGMVKMGSNIFAGTGNGVFLSTDDGMNWTERSNGLPPGFYSDYVQINKLASNVTTLIASTDSGLFRSSDYGVNWIAVNPTPPIENISTLAFSGTTLYAGTASGGYRSTDNGTNWSAIDTGLARTDISYYAVSESSRFALSDGYLFLTTDDGLTWVDRNNGLPLSYQLLHTVIYSGTNLYAGGYGIFHSGNNGLSWRRINSGLAGHEVFALAVSGSSLFAGTYSGRVFVSGDTGRSWSSASTGLPSSFSVRALALLGTNLYAGGAWGAYRSTDNGTNWTQILDTGEGVAYVFSFAIDEVKFFVGGDGGNVFLSNDNGGNWTEVFHGFPTPIYALTLSYNGAGDTNIFAGGWNGWVYRSTNNGISWSDVHIPELGGKSVKVLTSYSNGSGGAILIAGTEAGVFTSTNNGTHWTNTGLDAYVSSLTLSDENLFSGTYGGVWKRPLSEIITDVPQPAKELPREFSLQQNYPNPFNPSTTINYRLPSQSHVTLKIFDMLGREVATLVNDLETPGHKSVTFNASRISSGVYYYRLQAGNYVGTKRLILLR